MVRARRCTGCSIPQVILENVIKVPNDELAFQAYISANNTIFLFVAVCTAYGMVSPPTHIAHRPAPCSRRGGAEPLEAGLAGHVRGPRMLWVV